MFAAQRTSDAALTVMAINKDLSTNPAVNMHIANFASASSAQVWRLTASNAITRLPDTAVSASTVAVTLPAQSLTLLVIPSASTTQAPSAPLNLRFILGMSVAVVAGTPQTATINNSFATPLQVLVRDSSNSPAGGISVTFAAPTSGASALFGGTTTATVTTASNGIATAPPMTANASPGSYLLTASVTGATPASFSLINTSGGGGPGTGVWVNVTPSNVDLTNDLDCGNYGTQQIVADPARPSDLYAQFMCQGVWKSTDYGLTWQGPINTGTGGSGAKGAGGLAIARGAAGQPPILYFSSIRGTDWGFRRSLDGGVSWTKYTVASPSGRQDFYPPVVDPYNGNHLLMAGHEQNLSVQSFDGGQNWTVVPMVAGMNQDIGTAFFYFVNTGNAATTANTWLWIAQGAGGAVGTWRTSNGGSSWVKVDNNEHPHGNSQFYQPDTGGVIFMAGYNSALGWGVLRSTDYGQTWTHVGNALNEGVIFATPNKLYTMWRGHADTAILTRPSRSHRSRA